MSQAYGSFSTVEVGGAQHLWYTDTWMERCGFFMKSAARTVSITESGDKTLVA